MEKQKSIFKIGAAFFALLLLVLSGCVGKVKGTVLSLVPSLLESEFYIDPANVYMSVGQTKKLNFKNFQDPVTLQLQMGEGELDGDGNFVATAPSEVMIKAQDASGKSAYAIIVVSDLPIIRGLSKVTAGSLTQMAVEGGRGPYVYSIVEGQGQIDSLTGEFIAPSQAGLSKVKVTDANGGEATKEINVYPVISFAKPTQTVGANAVVSVSAGGGVGPLQYSILGGGGTIDSATGLFTANGHQGVEVVKATDSIGNNAFAFVTITSGSQATSFVVNPTSSILGQGQKQFFTVSNGQAPFSIRVKSGVGSVDTQTLSYTAPADQIGTAVVEIKDANNNPVDINIEVKQALSLGTTDSSVTVTPGGIFQVNPSGGTGSSNSDYNYSAERGSIDSNGAYTAPVGGGTDVITVTDSNGSSEYLYVKVQQSLVLAPSTAYLNSNAMIQLFTIGGAEPFTFNILSGEGHLEENYFKSPSTAGKTIIEVTDANGAKAQSEITTLGSLSVDPFYKIIVAGQSISLNISGGLAPYTAEIVTSAGEGTLTKSSDQIYVYQAGSTTQKFSQEILISDSQNNSVKATVIVNPQLSLAGTSWNITNIQSGEAVASGGIPPYQFSLSATGTAELEQMSSNSVSFKGLQAGTVSLIVTDSSEQTSSRVITVSQDYSVPPLASISGLPSSASKDTSFSITIGTAANSSTSISYYKYKVGASQATDCSQASGYSSEASVGTNLNLNIGALPEGEIKFCVIGRNSGSDGTNGTYQLLALATQGVWTKDTVGPSLGVSQPTNSTWVNLQNYRAIQFTGTCESGQIVALTGGMNSTITCANGAFSGTLDLLNVADGVINLVFNQSDSLGNAASQVTVTINKDVTAPTIPTNLVDGSVSPNLTTSPTIAWTASTDATAGVSHYQISIGTSAGAQDAKAWTDIGNLTSTSVGSLSLTDNQQYFVNLRAVDLQGNISGVVSSDGFVAKSLSIASISPTQSALAGGGVLTLTGGGFVNGATVKIGSFDCTSPNVLSATSITCTIPTSASTGVFDVVLTNGDSNTSTLSNGFSYLNVTELNLDPYWSDVVFLKHFDGADGATTFTADEFGQAVTSVVGTPAYGTPAQYGPTSLNIQGGAGVQVTPNANLNLETGDFTIEGWMYYTSAPSSAMMGIFQTAGYGGSNLSFRNYFGELQLFYDDAGGGELFFGATPPTMNTSTWYHYAIVRQGNEYSIYFNGSKLYSDIKTHTVAVGDFRIGCDRTYCFKGHLDEFRVTKRARYTGSTYTVPTESFSDSKTSVVFLNHFDGTDGSTNLADVFGQAPTSIRGTPLLKTDQKKFGSSSLYIGGAYVDGNNANPANNAWAQWNLSNFDMQYRDFTVDFWFKPDGSGGDYMASFGAYSSSIAMPAVVVRNDSKSHLMYRSWTDYYGTANTGYASTDWHHVAWVKRGATMFMYLDGVMSGSTNTFQAWNPFYCGFTLGKFAYYNGTSCYSDGNSFKGWFDEVRVTRGRALYQGGSFTIPTMPYQQ